MQRFSFTCDRIASTTKKLEKEKILSEYLSSLNDADLVIACRFLTGSPFAMRDQRTTNTGFAAVRDAIYSLDPSYEDRLGETVLKIGDMGAAVEVLFEARPVDPSLTLKDVESYYILLTTSNSMLEKRSLTASILSRATAAEAKYIIKILLGDMRIGLQESQVESSIAKAFGRHLREVQFANMLLGDIGEAAILAKENRLGEAEMRLLHPIKPMLASPEESVTRILEYMKGEGMADDKYDGIRAQIHKENSTVKIFSRDLADITDSFPEVVAHIGSIEGSILMDGEIVPYKDGNILTFGVLQKRFGRKDLTPEILEEIPCRYFAFDVLFYQGELFLLQPLRRRRAKLLEIHSVYPGAFLPTVQSIVRSIEEIESAFESARARNNEGLVIKSPDSLYTPGKRGKSWLKLKRALLTLDVVVVAAEYGHGKRAGLLSDYTFAVQHEGELLTIGKAYSGITDQELYRLSELFDRIAITQGYRRVVPPQVVLEVTFDRINKSDRHSSGYALRFPRIKRIRWDKAPDQIDTLETVTSLYNLHFS